MRRYIKGCPAGGNRLGGSITFDPSFISAVVGQCMLKPAFASTEPDVQRFRSMTQCLCVILCNLTTCCSIESAWLQRLKLKIYELLSNRALNFISRPYTLETISIEGVHHCDEEKHIYTLALLVENIDFTLGKSRVKASQVNMTLEGFKDGQSLTWEGTMGGDIEYEYDGLANSFEMQTVFELEWTSDSFKRAHFSGDYLFNSADELITVEGSFAFNYPCYSDPMGVQLSGTLNIANFQKGELQVHDLFAEAVIACTEGDNGTQVFKSFTFEISAGEITYKGHTVSASLVGDVYVYYEEDATGATGKKQKTAVKGTIDVEWNTDWNKSPEVGSSSLGRAVQVEPMKPMLKVPGTKRLKLMMNRLQTLFSVSTCAATPGRS